MTTQGDIDIRIINMDKTQMKCTQGAPLELLASAGFAITTNKSSSKANFTEE